MSQPNNPQCYACCPPSTVTIQPPPFVLTIPGPSLYCPDQPFEIEQHNPCANGGLQPSARAGALRSGASSVSRSTSFYTQGSQMCTPYGCSIYKF